MNKFLVFPALVVAFALGQVTPHAQTGAQKVGFVDVQALFAVSASHKEVQALSAKAQAELAPLEKQIQDLDAKGSAMTAAERDKRTQLVTTFTAKAKDYDAQIKAKAAPVEAAIDKALGDYAKANGFSVVMDRTVAQQSNLVVYADSATDITEAVKKNIK